MNQKEILEKVDYTLLKPTTTWDNIKALCDEAIEYKVFSVCIPPVFVKPAKQYLKNKVKVCTVIGFPNGYETTEVKQFEAEDAIKNGADEIDMVANIGDIKAGKFNKISDEINEIKEVCQEKTLKVIIETCLLTQQEKIKISKIIGKTKADYIKTSTGFSVSGATTEDVALLKRNSNKKIKASGGIRTFYDAQQMIEAGADRIGTSNLM